MTTQKFVSVKWRQVLREEENSRRKKKMSFVEKCFCEVMPRRAWKMAFKNKTCCAQDGWHVLCTLRFWISEIPHKFVCGSWFSFVSERLCNTHKHHACCIMLQYTHKKNALAPTEQLHKNNMQKERVENEWIRWSHSRNWPYECETSAVAKQEKRTKPCVGDSGTAQLDKVYTHSGHTHVTHTHILLHIYNTHRKTYTLFILDQQPKQKKTHTRTHAYKQTAIQYTAKCSCTRTSDVQYAFSSTE